MLLFSYGMELGYIRCISRSYDIGAVIWIGLQMAFYFLSFELYLFSYSGRRDLEKPNRNRYNFDKYLAISNII